MAALPKPAAPQEKGKTFSYSVGKQASNENQNSLNLPLMSGGQQFVSKYTQQIMMQQQ